MHGGRKHHGARKAITQNGSGWQGPLDPSAQAGTSRAGGPGLHPGGFWRSPQPLGNLHQYSVTCTAQKCFLLSRGNLPRALTGSSEQSSSSLGTRRVHGMPFQQTPFLAFLQKGFSFPLHTGEHFSRELSSEGRVTPNITFSLLLLTVGSCRSHLTLGHQEHGAAFV